MIKICSNDLEQIIRHCTTVLPFEACGIVGGQARVIDSGMEKEVLKVFHCNNELNSSVEYKISPEEQFQVFMEIEKRGLDLLGFYHSHPYTSAQPSSLDKARANYYGYSYVIIAMRPVAVSSWILQKEGVFIREELVITNV